jgi:hypothetical protein
MPSIAHARYRDGMNLYQYVRSSPANLVDPPGLGAIVGPGIEVGPDGVARYAPARDPRPNTIESGRGGIQNAWDRQDRLTEYNAGIDRRAAERQNHWVIGAGIGALRAIHGKTAVNIGGTRFYITGTPKAGMRIPASGTTSVLFVYKAGQPNKLYRLDFDVLKTGPRAGQLGWEHNQRGVARILKLNVTNHQPAGFVARNAGRAIKVLKWGGRAMIVVGAVQSGIEVYHAEDRARAVVTELSGWAAASGGAYLGGKGGAAAGAWVGSFFGPGPGTAIGAGVGGAIGSVGGGVGGFWLGKTVSETVYDWFVTPPEEEKWIICGEGGP